MSPVSYKSFTFKEIMNVELVPFGKMLARKLDKDYPKVSITLPSMRLRVVSSGRIILKHNINFSTFNQVDFTTE